MRGKPVVLLALVFLATACGSQLASLTDSSEKTLADEYRGTSSQYWIVVREGLVEQIDEQYVP